VPADVTYYNSAFELMLAIKLAGVDYDDFSEYGLSRFARFKETTYRDQWNQIQEREYSIYGDRVVSLYEAFGSVGDWYSDYTTTYNPLTRTLSKKLSSSKDPVKLDL